MVCGAFFPRVLRLVLLVFSGVETAVGDPSKEVERLEAAAKQREEAEEEADYRAVERGHVSKA